MKNFLKEKWIFFHELKNNPRIIGAAFPSSRSLAKAMVQQIPKDTKGLIVELGAGTGSITNYLKNKFSPNQLIVVERSEEMYQFLKNKFPNISIIFGDAIDLPHLITDFSQKVDVIISSLPLRSMTEDLLKKVQLAVFEILSEKGLFIQFTYDPRQNAVSIFPELKHLYYKKVWLNIPPARIDVYQKC